jgi:hypothetical protein
MVGSCDPSRGCVFTDQRTALNISADTRRFVWRRVDVGVDLYYDQACVPWSGNWTQSDEPHDNYCGPTAGMNVLDWYGTPSSYAQLGSEMKTNDWMSGWDLAWDCALLCGILLPDPSCIAACMGAADYFTDVGTSPDNMESALRKHSIVGANTGYLLYRRGGNPGLEGLERLLAQGSPVIGLIWTGSTLHWVTIVGTYNQEGTVMVRLANYGDESWEWLVHQWRFAGLDWPVTDILSGKGIEPDTRLYYERTTLLTAGQSLSMGQELISTDGRFDLTVDTAGHLVLFPLPWTPGNYLWSRNVANGQILWMQDDGNLVLRNAAGDALWASNTSGHPGAYLALQNDGNVVIYDAGNSPLWATNTGGH